MGLLQQGRGAGYEQAHVGALRAAKIRVGQQTRIEGRHTHEDTCPRQQIDDLARIELRQQQHGRRVQQRAMTGDEESVGVKQGQRV